MFDKYIKPKSLTWWAGVGLVAFGAITKQPEILTTGLGLIGMRGAIK